MFGAVKIVITMTPNGEVNVEGPLENKLVMFGLLDIARETVTKHNDKKDSIIATAPAHFMIPPNGGRG